MAQRITPFLMFEGAAEEAMRLYARVFPRSELRRLERWGPAGPGAAEQVRSGELVLAGQTLIFMDSPVTPSISLFVECESEAELDAAFAELSAHGRVLMEPANHGFSRKFAWIDDRFGVSWQLNLA
jgi:predicted 3-demethylubiquinone-9 3-methyltransferase (glyoxalase superfamily)